MGQIAQDAPLFKRIIVCVPKNAVFSEQTCHFEGFVPVFGHFSEHIFSDADIALFEYAIPKAAGGLPGCFKLQRPGMTVGEDLAYYLQALLHAPMRRTSGMQPHIRIRGVLEQCLCIRIGSRSEPQANGLYEYSIVEHKQRKELKL